MLCGFGFLAILKRTALLNSEAFYIGAYPPTIKCKFGDFGETDGTYLDEDEITCLTPDNQDLYDQISYTSFKMSVSMNGYSFDDQTGLSSLQTSGSASGSSNFLVVYLLLAISISICLILLLLFFLDPCHNGRPNANGNLEMM